MGVAHERKLSAGVLARDSRRGVHIRCRASRALTTGVLLLMIEIIVIAIVCVLTSVKRPTPEQALSGISAGLR